MPRRRPTDPIFAALGDPIRRIIFERLARQPRTAGEMAQTLPVTRTAVVQHLKILEAIRLVAATPDGRRRIYRIDPNGLDPLRV
jgi:DNA-binding transcriptional ArsR family regulator